MGDLHSIAYSSNLHNNLGVINSEFSHFVESTPPIFSPYDCDLSTGYLQDALFEFNDRSKRRRLLLFSDDQFKVNEPFFKGYWDSNQTENCSQNFSYLSQLTAFNGISGESMNRISQEANIFTEMQTSEEEISACEAHDSSSSSHKDLVDIKSIPDKENLYSLEPSSPSGCPEKRKKSIMKKRVVYPFAMVKPGGVEGDMTIKDINQRILMPPTRPVRHPVGDYACRPLVVSPDGPGLSGKAVVAFTRIHTQGRGTITIIRTKG